MNVKKTVFIFLWLCSVIVQAEPLLVAVLMVKNEEPVMELTLQPLVDAGITDFLIYDTGSTDQTVQVTQDFFIKNNITNFVIEQGDWVDFSTCRNRALELTEKYFPQAIFMLMVDAEWILSKSDELLKFCKEHEHDLDKIYAIKVVVDNHVIEYVRLIRCGQNVRFEGRVHEYINHNGYQTLPNSVSFEWRRSDYGKEKSKARWLLDLDILLQDLQDEPENPRTVFYLAQTYFCLHDWENAAKWYEKRATMKGWDEETYVAIFTLAQAYQNLKNYDQMIFNYLKAFSCRPIRAEPLIELAKYYFNIESYNLCYLFARYACTVPIPKYDAALLNMYAYTFVRYNILSAVAYYQHDFELGYQATLKALKARPDLQYLYDNLKEYQVMLAKNV